MVAGRGSKIPREGYSNKFAPDLLDDLFARAKTLGLDFFEARPGPAMIDDHVPLIQAGIKAVDLIGAGYSQWHTSKDTPENCSPELLEQTGKLLLDFLYNYPF